MRICAIDVGTNTVNSLVADVESGGLVVVADEEQFARLGQGVDRAGRLAEDAMDRVVDRLARAKATAENLGAERVVIAATSASRDASNVDVLQGRVWRELGLDYRVISGAEEARLSFLGALALLPDVPRAVVFDIGGGSTEIVAGERGAPPHFAQSLDIGTVRLTERHGAVPPVGVDVQAAVRDDIARALAAIPPEVWAHGPLVGTGSTARVVSRMGPGALRLGAVRVVRQKLAALTPQTITALAPEVMRGRADVMPSAMLIVEGVMEAAGTETFHATRGGLRHGLALETAR